MARYTALFAQLNRHIRLVACCDPAPDRAARFARRFRIPQVYTEYDALLSAATKPDALYLAVPHHLHHPMALQAIAAGIPALIEKPLARTPAEGQEIADSARMAGVKVGVNYQYRYDTGCYTLARVVQAGVLGEIRYVRCHLPWHREEAYFAGRGWHARLDTAGGGTLITQGSHLLDVALWALGGRPAAALGYTAERVFREVCSRGPRLGDHRNGRRRASGNRQFDGNPRRPGPEHRGLRLALAPRPTATVPGRMCGSAGCMGPGRSRPVAASMPSSGVWRVSVPGLRTKPNGPPYLIPAAEAVPVLTAVDARFRSARLGHREEVTL